MQKLKKTLFICVGVIVLVVVLAILFISPITKYLVEKYDEQITGRQIKIESAYANVFTGYVNFSNVNAYELNSDSVFLSADAVKLNFNVAKMLSNNFEIRELTIESPKVTILQKKKS